MNPPLLNLEGQNQVYKLLAKHQRGNMHNLVHNKLRSRPIEM